MFRNIKDVKVGTVVGGMPKYGASSNAFYPSSYRIGVVIFVSEKGPWCIVETPVYRTAMYAGEMYTINELLGSGHINCEQIEELIDYCKKRGIHYEGN